MFKIGEFSKITQVSVRMLRYYDEQKLLQPRLVDKMTGYRLYSADQIEQLNKIIFLRNMGFGVESMKNMIDSWNLESISKSLHEQMDKVNENIKAEQMKLEQIKGMIYDLENQDKQLNIDIVLKSLPMQHVISMRKTVPDYYSEGFMWKEFGEILKNIRNVDRLQSFSIYHDLDDREKDVDIEICVVIDGHNISVDSDKVISRQIPAVNLAACFMIHGPYSNISKAYKEFAYWLERHDEYKMQGENRQICHVAACDTDNPEEYITELQIPLALN